MARRLTEHRLPRRSSPPTHWRGARLRTISRCVRTAANPCRHPRASFPRCEVLDLRGSRPGRAVAAFQPAASSHTTNTHTPARIRIHSTLGLTIIAHDQPLRFSLSCRAPHAAPTTRESRGTHSVFLFFFGVHTPFLAGLSFFLFASRCAGRSFFLSACFALRRALRAAAALSFFLLASRCAARHARPPAKTRLLARIPTTDGRTTRRAVRRHG